MRGLYSAGALSDRGARGPMSDVGILSSFD
jgi:hypothetical protein